MAEAHSVLLFDTQRAVEELVAAGMPPEQAGAVVRQQARWADRDFATGEDIDRLQAEIGKLRAEFTGESGLQREEIGRVREEIGRVREEFGGEFGRVREEFGGEFGQLREEFGGEFGQLREEFGGQFSQLRAEFDRKLKAQGATIAKDMDHLRERLETRFETVEVKFEAIEQKIDARCAALETKITQSSADTIRWVAGSQIGTAAVYLAALLAAIKL